MLSSILKPYPLCLFFILFLGHIAVAQNETSKWYFGVTSGLDFMPSPPIPIANGLLVTSEGCASASDATGNLLFYTDGSTVWNAANAVMANGTGLNGNTSTSQSAIVVKQPGNANIYFIFTLDCCNSPTGLNYSVVDMNLAAGLGSVTVLNSPLAGVSSERLTSVKHCNGTDFWVLSQDGTNGNFRAHQVSAGGVNAVPVISAIGTNSASGAAFMGCMKFSPNGKKLGVAVNGLASEGFEIYDFDASTGLVSNRLLLYTESSAYGTEFSPDGTKFYGSAMNGSYLYQWDLCAGSNMAIVSSMYTANTTGGCALQQARDGKIYLARIGSTMLGVVNNPNVAGAGCNYVDNGQAIPGVCLLGLPNFVTSHFNQPATSTPFTYTPNCQSVSFSAPPAFQNYTLNACAASGYSLTNMIWNFGDPASGITNTSTVANPTHTFSTFGTFTTSLILYYSCGGGTDTLKQGFTLTPCIQVNSSNISCSGPGSASVISLNGPGPFSYTWLPGGQTGSVVSGLYAGTYSIVVFNSGNNTTYSTTTTLTNTATAFSNTLSNSTAVACFGANTGTASIIVSGGSGNQNYFWFNGVNTITTPTVGNLTAGNYTVSVIDAVSSCSLSNTFTIVQPPALSITINSNTPSNCVGAPVTLTATCAGGTAGYTYTWSNGPQLPINVVTQSLPGNYIYTVSGSDANNCIATTTVLTSFVAIPQPSISATSTLLCAGSGFTLNGSSGNLFSWSGPGNYNSNAQSINLPNANPSMSGTYTLAVNVGACVATATQAIVVNPLPTPGISATPVCKGNNLQITAIAGGGILFQWAGPLNFTSSIANPLITNVTPAHAGLYTLTVSDVNNCVASVTAPINILQDPLIQTVSKTVCFGTSATLNASGAMTYTWSGPSGYTANGANAVIIKANSASQQIYTVTGTALNTCTASAQASLSTLALPSPSLFVSPRACVNTTVSLQGSGGTTYRWDGPFNFSDTHQNVIFTASSISYAGTYTLTATNAMGCKGYTTAILQLDPLPEIAIQYTTTGQCVPFCTNFGFSLQTQLPLSNLYWQVSGKTYTTTNFTSCFKDAGIYTINAIFKDSIGCNNQSSYAIHAHPVPKADFIHFPASPMEGPDPVEFKNTSTGPNLSQWNWYFINNNGYTAITENTSYVFENAGVYPVAMTVRNIWGCEDTLVKHIAVQSDFGLFVPNAFTPNADGNNETFQPKGVGIVKYNMTVFNRWGQKLFETSNFTQGWDGMFKGEECQSDVYIWKVQATNTSGKQKAISGHVTLCR